MVARVAFALVAGAYAQSQGAAVWEDTVNLVQQHTSHSGVQTSDKLSMGSTGYWCISDINPGVVQCMGPELSCVKCVNKYFQCIDGYVPVLDYFGAMHCATGQKRAECLKKGCKPGGCCEQTCCPPQPTELAFQQNPRLALAIDISKKVADFLNITKDVHAITSNLKAIVQRRRDTYETMKAMEMEQKEWEAQQHIKLESAAENRAKFEQAKKRAHQLRVAQTEELKQHLASHSSQNSRVMAQHLRRKRTLVRELKKAEQEQEDRLKKMKLDMEMREKTESLKASVQSSRMEQKQLEEAFQKKLPEMKEAYEKKREELRAQEYRQALAARQEAASKAREETTKALAKAGLLTRSESAKPAKREHSGSRSNAVRSNLHTKKSAAAYNATHPQAASTPKAAPKKHSGSTVRYEHLEKYGIAPPGSFSAPRPFSHLEKYGIAPVTGHILTPKTAHNSTHSEATKVAHSKTTQQKVVHSSSKASATHSKA